MALHHLNPVPVNVTDVFSRDLPPVLTVAPGDTVIVRSLDASGYLTRQRHPGDRPATMHPGARGHCLTGPIEVTRADTSMTLAVTLVSVQPDDWGWTVAAAVDNPLAQRLGVGGGPPSWLLWSLDPTTRTGTNDRGLTVDLAPFLGVIGLPPTEHGEHSTIPPRSAGGGNIDCRELVEGSTLYLPVTVPGAMLCLGDGHAAQGDGEVGGTAIECPMTTEVHLDLVPYPPISGIHALTPRGKITFGFSPDLNEATAAALDSMLAWMQVLFGVDKSTALALASAVVDMHVTQIANKVWGVHALLPEGALR